MRVKKKSEQTPLSTGKNIIFHSVVPAYLVWIFTRDTCCDHVAPGRGRSRQSLKVDGGVSPRLDTVQHPDVFYSLERNTHGNLTGKERHQPNSNFNVHV